MKEKPRTVYVRNSIDWESKEFRFLLENTIFSFDKEQIFTASCSAYTVDGYWFVLVKNKDMENFFEDRKKREESKFFL